MSRLPELTLDQMTPAQRQVHENIASGPRGSVRGPFAPLMHAPGAADIVQQMGAYLRFKGTLPDKLRELAILVTGRFWTAQYEWYAHLPIAIKAGLDPSIADAIASQQRPEFSEPAEEIVYDYAMALHYDHQVDDAAYKRALDLLGPEGVVELTVLCGFYTIISMTLNAFEVGIPDGSKPLKD